MSPAVLIDLSVPLHTGMPVWPGDPEVEFTPAATVATHGYNLLALRLGSQSGTHVEAPFHVDDALPALADVPLERFTGRAVVADLRHKAPRDARSRPPTSPRSRRGSGPGIVLLLATGCLGALGHRRSTTRTPTWTRTRPAWSSLAAPARWASTHPASTRAHGGDDGRDPLPAHRVLAAAGAVIAENLTNLSALLHRRRRAATSGCGCCRSRSPTRRVHRHAQ